MADAETSAPDAGNQQPKGRRQSGPPFRFILAQSPSNHYILERALLRVSTEFNVGKYILIYRQMGGKDNAVTTKAVKLGYIVNKGKGIYTKSLMWQYLEPYL